MEVKVEQRSASWFELRKKHIGGSDVAPILSISPWKTALDVYNEKMSAHTDQAPKNPWMQRGVDMEDEALRAFENKTGYLMSPKVMISDLTPFAMASFDGFEIDGKCAVEIKCGGQKAHLTALYGDIPVYYKAQMQHQMYVAELDEIYYCSYRPEHTENPIAIMIVKRDEEFIIDMIEKERKFYEEHMLTGIPPKKEEKYKRMDSPVWNDIAAEYTKQDNIEKEAAKRKEELKDMLLQMSNMENARGNGIVLQKIERKGIIDYKNIPEIKQMDLEKHRKPSTSYWQVKEVSDE